MIFPLNLRWYVGVDATYRDAPARHYMECFGLPGKLDGGHAHSIGTGISVFILRPYSGRSLSA